MGLLTEDGKELDVKGLSKKELMELVGKMKEENEGLKVKIDSRGKGRKEVLFDLLGSGKVYSGDDLSGLMSDECGCVISNRNVSSLLCYLRSDIKSGKLKDVVIVKIGSNGNKMVKKGEENYEVFKSMM